MPRRLSTDESVLGILNPSPATIPLASSYAYNFRLPAGGPDLTVHLFLRELEGAKQGPKTGLAATPGCQLVYLGPDDQKARTQVLLAGPTASGECGFWEIDSCFMPGLYGLQIPAQMRQPGFSFIQLRLPGAMPCLIQVHGVKYDPYESFSMSLTTWARSNCHENLTSGIRKSLPVTLRPLLITDF